MNDKSIIVLVLLAAGGAYLWWMNRGNAPLAAAHPTKQAKVKHAAAKPAAKKAALTTRTVVPAQPTSAQMANMYGTYRYA